MSEEKIKNDYEQYVKNVTPTSGLLKNMFHAFLVGGAICLIAQWLKDYFVSAGFSEEIAGYYEMVILILTAVILTGLGLYSKLAKFAGAGTLVPITGFANSISSSAIEFKSEGQVFGIGCRIFSIAGPVILYGIFSTWCLGLIYWLWITFF